MRCVDAFVPPDASDLVDAFEAADDQAFEVQLGRDTQIEIEIERVVVGAEGSRGRAARDVQHRRRLAFDEAVRIAESAHFRDDLRARQEDRADVFVHQQVDVALTVALLDVG